MRAWLPWAAAAQAFEANKKLRIAQATIDAIAAGVSLIPAFSFLGPAAPAAAAAVAGSALGLAVSQINATQPPEFPTGRIPTSADHALVGVQPEEAILSRRGVATRGGPEAVRQDNAGIPQGPQVVNVNLGRRTLAQAMVSAAGEARVDPRRGRRNNRR
jgi:hypothetical protein